MILRRSLLLRVFMLILVLVAFFSLRNSAQMKKLVAFKSRAHLGNSDNSMEMLATERYGDPKDAQEAAIEYQANISSFDRSSVTLPSSCQGARSLDNHTRRIALTYSPPYSGAWNKSKDILTHCHHFRWNQRDKYKLFTSVASNIMTMLEGWG